MGNDAANINTVGIQSHPFNANNSSSIVPLRTIQIQPVMIQIVQHEVMAIFDPKPMNQSLQNPMQLTLRRSGVTINSGFVINPSMAMRTKSNPNTLSTMSLTLTKSTGTC